MTEIFLNLVNRSIAAGWIVAVVILLRLVLKKAPWWTKALLWGMAAVRLVCPISVKSMFSLLPSAETIPKKILSGPDFAVQTGITPIDSRVNAYLGDRYFEGGVGSCRKRAAGYECFGGCLGMRCPSDAAFCRGQLSYERTGTAVCAGS